MHENCYTPEAPGHVPSIWSRPTPEASGHVPLTIYLKHLVTSHRKCVVVFEHVGTPGAFKINAWRDGIKEHRKGPRKVDIKQPGKKIKHPWRKAGLLKSSR